MILQTICIWRYGKVGRRWNLNMFLNRSRWREQIYDWYKSYNPQTFLHYPRLYKKFFLLHRLSFKLDLHHFQEDMEYLFLKRNSFRFQTRELNFYENMEDNNWVFSIDKLVIYLSTIKMISQQTIFNQQIINVYELQLHQQHI